MLYAQKLRALMAHLAVSSLVVGGVLGLVVLAWYPHPYFQALGTWNVVKVLIGVDLVLGPVLTFIVYRPGKRTLVFDLSVIAAIQLAALFYGTSVVYQERPYFTVFSVDRFEVMARHDVDFSEIGDAQLVDKPLRGPRLIVASLPDDPQAREALIRDVVTGRQPDVHYQPAYWSRYEDGVGEVIAAAQPLERLRAARSGDAARIERAVRRHGGDETRLGFVPLVGKERDLAMVVERSTGRPLGAVDVDPWLPRTAALSTGEAGAR